MALTYCPLRSSIRSGIRNASAISRTASPMRTYGSVRERKNNLATQRGKSAGSRASRDFNEVLLEHRQKMIPPTNLIIFANNLKFFFQELFPLDPGVLGCSDTFYCRHRDMHYLEGRLCRRSFWGLPWLLLVSGCAFLELGASSSLTRQPHVTLGCLRM